MTGLKLRDYQHQAQEAVLDAWDQGIRRPAVVLPTGTGKTVLFASIAAEMRKLGVRSGILAHRDELISQAVSKIRATAPELNVGVYQGTRREVDGRDVIVASVGSLTRPERRAELAQAGLRLVIVDECHHATADTYMATLRDLGCFEERGLEHGAAALGVTATMTRSDRVALGQVWEKIVYTRSIVQSIREGNLVNAKGLRVRIAGLDLSRIKRGADGDLAEGEVAQAMHDAMAPAAIARAYQEHAKGELGVCFTPGVPMAYELAEAFQAAGIPAAAVDGTTPVEQRREILRRHSRGDIQIICNAMVLTEGWDAPWVSVVVIARPTHSAGLYVQMAGRGLRPHPGKKRCLIMDVVGVTGKHKLAGLADLGGAERVEKLDDDLAVYDEDGLIDLLGTLDPEPASKRSKPEESRSDGPLVTELVDLFGSRHRTWLKTPRGVWFLPAGDALIFLAPSREIGQYLVGRVMERKAGGEWLVSDPVDLTMAMTWGEQHAETTAGTLNRKGAAWRRGVPGQQQRDKAERLGIIVGTQTKGELSDEISRVLGAGRLDAMPCVATVTERGYW